MPVIDSSQCLSVRTLQRLTEREGSLPKLRLWSAHLAECTACCEAAQSLNLQAAILNAVSEFEGPGSGVLLALRQRFLGQTSLPHEPSRDEILEDDGFDPIPSIDDEFPSDVRPLHQEAYRDTTPIDKPSSHSLPPHLVKSLPRPAPRQSPVVPATSSATGLEKLLQLLKPAQLPGELARIGGYRLLEVLGAGAVGIVFLAEDIGLRRRVALKLLQYDDLGNEVARARFLREGRAVAALEHPHIVSVYQVGEDQGIPFMAMQLLEGETLDDRLKRDHQLKLLDLLRIAREIALGLAIAHEHGMVHRDIKPANIWLEARTGRVKILDFGLARAISDETQLTKTGNIVGTPAFMSPEQARGADLDQRSDLYSLGSLIYIMCAGVPPHQAEDVMAMLLALATEQPRPLQSLVPDVPPPLAGLVNRLLAKYPQARPSTAGEVVTTLETIEKVLPRLMPEDIRHQWLDLQGVEVRKTGISGTVIALWVMVLVSLSIVLFAFVSPDSWKKPIIDKVKKVFTNK